MPESTRLPKPTVSPSSISTTVVERYFSRDSHGTGMVFDLTLELDGPVDETRLFDAWSNMLTRHPRLHATLHGTGRRQYWSVDPVDAGKSFHVVDLEPRTDPTSVPGPDVRSGTGACLLVSSNSQYIALRFRFHHCACDGVGAARVIGDFLAELHGRWVLGSGVQGSGTQDQTSQAALESTTQSASRIPDLRNTWKTIRGRNVRVGKHVFGAGMNEPANAIDTHCPELRPIASDTWAFELDDKLSQKLRSKLRQAQIPLNDYAVAAISNALATVSAHSASRKTHVMVMNPTQMRRWSDRRSSANHLGFAFVRRRHQELQFSDPVGAEQILNSVHREIHDVRTLGIAGELAFGIGAVESMPGALAMIERFGWFTPTASLTCLSSIRFTRRYGFVGGSKIDQSEIRRVNMAAPLQAGGELAATIWDLGDRISWSFRFAARHPRVVDVARLMALSIQHFSKSLTDSSSQSGV
ncbi:MAG: hypothetical protein KDB00_09560 [Planctomycetales bacterium]|nr:hypothetical protein [Planctomycetales bacterium]